MEWGWRCVGWGYVGGVYRVGVFRVGVRVRVWVGIGEGVCRVGVG